MGTAAAKQPAERVPMPNAVHNWTEGPFIFWPLFLIILLLSVPANANKSGGQICRQLPAPGCWRPPWACKTPILPNRFRKDYPSDSWPNRWQSVDTTTNDLPAIVQRLAVHLPSICKRIAIDLPSTCQRFTNNLPSICRRFAVGLPIDDILMHPTLF